MNNLIESSKEIFQYASEAYKPKAIIMMLSGGDDSMCAYHVAKSIGIKFDCVVHGNTRTGIKDTTDFVRKEVERMGDIYLEADAGTSYEDYVMRKGFFGIGEMAHSYSYHILKWTFFRKAISENIRHRRRDFPIMFINGARRQESERRKKTMISPYKVDPKMKNNIWVNIINEWPSRHDCVDFLEGNGIKRNPVSINLCRSGECMCGTMQSIGDYNEAKFHYPEWGRRMDELRQRVRTKFPWDWGENINKYHLAEMNGQLRMDFQPMCIGCKMNYEQANNID